MTILLKTYITDFRGVHEARFLATVPEQDAWHYVAMGWADFAGPE